MIDFRPFKVINIHFLEMANDDMSSVKKSQLHTSVGTYPFYLNIESFFIDKETQITYYVVQFGVQIDSEIVVKNKHLRYSELYRLHKEIEKLIPNNTNFPDFPKKKIFGNKKINFLKQRMNELNQYISCLTQIPNIMENHTFRKTFSIGCNYY